MFKKENFELVVMFILGLASIFWCINISDSNVVLGLSGAFCLIYIEYNCILKDDKIIKPEWMFWITFTSFIVIWTLSLESFIVVENLVFFICSVMLLFDRIIDFRIKTNPVYLEREDNKDENRVHVD